MKTKKYLSFFMALILSLGLVGCGDSDDNDRDRDRDKDEDKEVTATVAPTNTPTPIPDDDFVDSGVDDDDDDDDYVPDEPEEKLLFTYDLVASGSALFLDYEKGFHEDRAWVALSSSDFNMYLGNGTLALIDTDGKILYKMDAYDQFANTLGEDPNSIDIYPVFTRMKEGYSVIYNTKGEGFIIVDKDGNETYNTNDGDSNTHYYFVGQYDNRFLCVKEESSFSSNEQILILINCDGDVLNSDLIPDFSAPYNTRYEEIGGGLLYGDYGVINTNNWNYITGSFSNSLLDVGQCDGGYYPIKTSNGCFACTIDDFESQDTYDAFISSSPNKISFTTYGEGLSYLADAFNEPYTFKAVDRGREIVPDIPDSVEINRGDYFPSAYQRGYSFIKMTGADGNPYYGVLDSEGKFTFDPIINDFAEHTSYACNGYLACAPEHDSYYSTILCDNGDLLKIGTDDCSVLGDTIITAPYSDTPIVCGGFFNGSELNEKDFGFSDGYEFFVSLDGSKIISQAYEYTPVGNDLLTVEANLLYPPTDILNLEYDKLAEVFNDELPSISNWEWDANYDGYFDYTYKGHTFAFFFSGKTLKAIRYEVVGSEIDNYYKRFGYVLAGEGLCSNWDAEGNQVLSKVQYYGYAGFCENYYFRFFYNPYDDIDHIVMEYTAY